MKSRYWYVAFIFSHFRALVHIVHEVSGVDKTGILQSYVKVWYIVLFPLTPIGVVNCVAYSVETNQKYYDKEKETLLLFLSSMFLWRRLWLVQSRRLCMKNWRSIWRPPCGRIKPTSSLLASFSSTSGSSLKFSARAWHSIFFLQTGLRLASVFLCVHMHFLPFWCTVPISVVNFLDMFIMSDWVVC